MIVSVIICTRDRGPLLAATLHSILDGTRRPDELLVVDQSDGDETRQVVEAMAAAQPALRYVPTGTRGLSRARNVGLTHSRGDVLAFTDDDVVVCPDWLERVAAEFQAYPRLAFLFGTVLPPESYDWETEFIPHCRLHTRRGGRWFHRDGFGGMGANMALRRTTFERLGGFDVTLGAGTGVAGEDHEYALRCLCHHPPLAVHLLDEARVVHHAGARSGAEYHKFVHQVYGTGTGQFLARLCFGYRRPPYVAVALLGLVEPLGGFLVTLLRGRRLDGLRTYAYTLQGFAQAARRALTGGG